MNETCPTCGRDSARSEEWSTGQCDDCYLENDDTPAAFNALDFIMAFEAGDLTWDEVVTGFQHLINDGSVWHLQGLYGRTAVALIEAGLCEPRVGNVPSGIVVSRFSVAQVVVVP